MEKKNISRKKVDKVVKGKKTFSWDYFDQQGRPINNQKNIDRCNKLVLPPAWTDVWISTNPKSNLQATGRDAKGRLQYRYHEDWTKAQAAKKFSSMAEFAHILPTIRKKIEADMLLEGMPKNKVV